MSGTRPPILLVVGTQLLSVIGDAFGQRVSRVDHKRNHKHMMLALAMMSALQVLVILGILELALPAPTVSNVYINRAKVDCWKETWEGSTMDCYNPESHCHAIECRRQGPSVLWQYIPRHPTLLWNCVMDIAYYGSEVLLYKEPLGLLLLVLASLTSSFLIHPVNWLLGNPATKIIPTSIMMLGIVGGIACIVERTPSKLEEETSLIEQPEKEEEREEKTKWRAVLRTVGLMLRIFPPFIVLSIVYAAWFTLQIMFNDRYQVNVWGYTSLDQVLLPLCLGPVLWMSTLWKKPYQEEGRVPKETFLGMIRSTWGEANLLNLFVYRLLINTRAMLYFFLALTWDLNLVYLELTLVRVILSWVGSVVLTLLFPRFIDVTEKEKATTFDYVNLGLKCIGTVAVVVALLLL